MAWVFFNRSVNRVVLTVNEEYLCSGLCISEFAWVLSKYTIAFSQIICFLDILDLCDSIYAARLDISLETKYSACI